jgi:phage N-6-adenine-methyltransferase
MSEQRGKETFNRERSDDYPTPHGIIVLTRIFFDGVVDLDPATSSDNPVAARHFFTKADNGLEQSWQGFESVYINPPYTQEWYRKIADEVTAGAVETIALLKASPCTRWAQEVILPPASAVCFIKGRLTFGNETSPAGFGSMLIYFGSQRRRFAKVFDDLGWVVPISTNDRKEKCLNHY